MGGNEDMLAPRPNQKTLIVIAGPTAVGKTSLAIQLAQHYNTSILSADSRQFYREMSIGTAKPTEDELKQAKHYFVNTHSITENLNVGDFETEGLKILDAIFAEKDVAILAGGSGLYIKAICEGFDDIPSANIEVRNRLNTEFETTGIHGMQERLKALDPEYYDTVDKSNPQRIIRALEVIEATGQPFSSYRTAGVKERPFSIIKIGLNLPRELLYQRINLRVDLMVQEGLVAEVTSLLPYKDHNALNTVGYKEIFEYLEGKTTLDTAIAMIKQNTRRFAKRQLTWFNKDKSTMWFNPNDTFQIISIIDNNSSK